MLILPLIKMGGYGRRAVEIIGNTRREFLQTCFGLKPISKIKKVGVEIHAEEKQGHVTTICCDMALPKKKLSAKFVPHLRDRLCVQFIDRQKNKLSQITNQCPGQLVSCR
jgi:hypothetical protein